MVKHNTEHTNDETAPIATDIDAVPVTIDAETRGDYDTYGSIINNAIIQDFTDDDDEDDDDGPLFKDLFFAILFLVHLAVMLFLGIRYGTYEIEEMNWNVTQWKDLVDDDDDGQKPTDEEWTQFESLVSVVEAWMGVYPDRIFSYIMIPAALVANVLGFVLTALVIPACPTTMVKMTVLGSYGCVIVFGLFLCTVSNFNVMAILLSAGMIYVVGVYVKSVWRLVPFASINLAVAVKGISSNSGIYLVAICLSVVGVLCWAAWLYILVGVMQAVSRDYEVTHPKSSDMNDAEYMEVEQSDPRQGATFIALVISLYWTLQVINNTVEVTVAGVMATWCFVKQEAQSYCSPGVYGSLGRSLSYSFGSICLGSLLQVIVTVLRGVIQKARSHNERNNGRGICFSLLECIAKCLEGILDYFNQWAYVYVGIYGYSYLQSGKKVVDLFKARGFTAFVTNDLVGYVLKFTNAFCGVMTGLICIYIQSSVDNNHSNYSKESFLFGQFPSPHLAAMLVGFFVGLAVCSLMMHVVRGAVNTLIVCYADAPNQLEENHPDLFQRMADAWSQAFPEAVLNAPSYEVVV